MHFAMLSATVLISLCNIYIIFIVKMIEQIWQKRLIAVIELSEDDTTD